MNDKIELMKKLLDLYQQSEYVTIACSKMIVEEYIKKLESQLKGML